MQVNRLSLGLQEALKIASNYNTARSDTLFEQNLYGTNGEKIDFSNLNIDDLNITEDQIQNLLQMFADEIIAVFGSEIPGINPNNNQPKNTPGQTTDNGQTSDNGQSQGGNTPTVFTA